MRRPSVLGLVLLAALVLLATGCSKPGGSTTTATPSEYDGSAGEAPDEVDVPPEYQNGDATAGKVVFMDVGGCGSCHTLSDAGTSGTVGPNLDASQPDLELAVDRIVNGQGGMPPFKGTLTDKQIADVAAYIVGATS